MFVFVSSSMTFHARAHAQRLEEIHMAVEAGAAEIDIVISREYVISNNWAALFDEVKQMRQVVAGWLTDSLTPDSLTH